jgi:hypothetical protein
MASTPQAGTNILYCKIIIGIDSFNKTLNPTVVKTIFRMELLIENGFEGFADMLRIVA